MQHISWFMSLSFLTSIPLAMGMTIDDDIYGCKIEFN